MGGVVEQKNLEVEIGLGQVVCKAGEGVLL